ncbi:MAG: DUF397 domain-containing protein [Pseudonocardiaceae bacterium]
MWRKSTHSGGPLATAWSWRSWVRLWGSARDSKDQANGPILIVTPGEWGRVPRRGERPRVQPAVAGGVFRRRSESCASRVSKHTRT